jgi:hypothetical protein
MKKDEDYVEQMADKVAARLKARMTLLSKN